MAWAHSPIHGSSAPRNISSSPIALAAARMMISRPVTGPSRLRKLWWSSRAHAVRLTATRDRATTASPSRSPNTGDRSSRQAAALSSSR